MKIIVTGSLGNIGKPLTEELVQKGHAVTVISRSPEKQAEIEALGAKAAIGQMEDIDFLVSVFNGADVVFGLVPPTHAVNDPLEHNMKLGNCIVQALGRSDVKRAVYVSSYGAQLAKGTGLIEGHYHIEKALGQLPNLESLAILRATYIYYNFKAYIGMIKAAGFIAANYGDDDKVVMVSPKDIAAAAVEEIESPAAGKKIRYIASDERTCNEIAAVLGAAIGKPDLKWVTITDEQMRNGMEANGLSAIAATRLVEMFGALHSGLLHEDYELHVPEKMGKVKLEAFAHEFAAAFNA